MTKEKTKGVLNRKNTRKNKGKTKEKNKRNSGWG